MKGPYSVRRNVVLHVRSFITSASLVLLIACAGEAGERGARPNVPSVSEQCGVSGNFESLTITASDGTRLAAALIGRGTTGVLLAHQFPADMCQWATYAPALARHGFLVLVIDFRCLGGSECPNGPAGKRVDLDAAAGVHALRREGAKAVAMVGASAGGTAVLVSAARIEPPVDAVVTLSAERNLAAVPAGYLTLNAGRVVPRLQSPVLFVVARDDAYVSVSSSRRMYKDASPRATLFVLPGKYGHGLEMLEDSWSSRVGRLVLDFLKKHSV
jgi:pimeloyl-ACP methyl ester carboxylesterase